MGAIFSTGNGDEAGNKYFQKKIFKLGTPVVRKGCK